MAFLHSQGPQGKVGDKGEKGIPGTLAVLLEPDGGPQPLENGTFDKTVELTGRAVLVVFDVKYFALGAK